MPLEEFYESTFTYQLSLSELPAITAIAAEPNALVQMVQLRQDDTHYVVFIHVTAPDGHTTQGYTLAITLRTLRSTALLSDIRANNQSIDGFAPTTSPITYLCLRARVCLPSRLSRLMVLAPWLQPQSKVVSPQSPIM